MNERDYRVAKEVETPCLPGMFLRSSLRAKPFWVFSQNSPTPVFYPKAIVTTGDREFGETGDSRSLPVDPAYKYKPGWYLEVVTICLDGLCKTKLQVVRRVCQACHKMPLPLASVASRLLVRARGIDWGRGQRAVEAGVRDTGATWGSQECCFQMWYWDSTEILGSTHTA